MSTIVLIFVLEASQAKESILYHVLIHLLHKLLILSRLLKISLVDPIQSLETFTVKIFHFDLHHLLILLCLHLLILLLLLSKKQLLLACCHRVEMEPFIH